MKAIIKQDASAKYLPYMSEDIVSMMFEGSKIRAYFVNHDLLDFKLIAEVSKLKQESKDTLVAAIVSDDCHLDIIKSLCDMQSIDLVIPLSKRYLIKAFEEASDFISL